MLFIAINSNAQFEFKIDSSGKSTYQKYFDSVFKTEREFEFQVVFHKLTTLPPDARRYLVLTYQSNQWTARLFKPEIDSFAYNMIEYPFKGRNTSLLWKALKEGGILGLKSHSELEDSLGQYADVPVLDGASYTITLRNKEGHRDIWYLSPGAHTKHFPYIPEFRQMIHLIHLFQEFMGDKKDFLYITDPNCEPF